MHRVLIIGGYGNAGRLIALHLLKHSPNAHVTIAGRREDKALEIAQRLEKDYPGRVAGRMVDLADVESIDHAFSETGLVVNAAGAIPHTRKVAEALLRHGKNAFDTQLASSEKTSVLEEFAPRFEAAGITYITDCGFHPGIPGAMVRFAAGRTQVLEKANVYSAMKFDWHGLEFSPETMIEFIEEFRTYRLPLYLDGQWKDQSGWKFFTYDFGAPHGKQYCVPMLLPEMEDVVKQLPALRETGFLVTGFNPVADYLVLPILLAGLRVLPRSYDKQLAKLLFWSLKFSRPPFGIELVADCNGQKDGKPVHFTIKLAHEDGYLMTAVPVVACLLQLLDGSIQKAGLLRQAIAVEPERFFADLEKMGLKMESFISSSPAKTPAAGTTRSSSTPF